MMIIMHIIVSAVVGGTIALAALIVIAVLWGAIEGLIKGWKAGKCDADNV